MTRRLWPVFVAALLFAGISQPTAMQALPTPSDRVADLIARRAQVMRTLGPNTALVLWSAPTRVYSADTNYEYRQESNLLYLTGLAHEPIALVLVSTPDQVHEFLFVPALDPVRALWDGPRLTPSAVTTSTGVANVFAQRGTEAFDAFIRGWLAPTSAAPADSRLDAAQAGASVATTGDARVALLVPSDPGSRPTSADARPAGWRARLEQQFPGRKFTFVDASPTLLAQRQVKTAYEQQVLRRSVAISAEAHIEGMKVARPGRWEYEVEAAIEHWFLKNGALSWGYPSIVGSGPNATVLHYVASTRQMRAGDLVLVDAAGSYQGLTGDITRTYPVSRRFSPEQRELYEVVLAAENAGIQTARPGSDPNDVTRAVRAALGAGFLKIGLVTDPAAASGESPQISWWFPHGPIHGIGIDVHEPLDRLLAGAAFVIEPGAYVRTDTFERLAANPALADVVRAIRPAVDRYRDLGIRVEDSFLMTASGPENLSRQAPRQIRDIERVVGSGR